MIRLIAAVDRKLGIAKHGFQPWFIPQDEQYFLDQTSKYGANVLMGSKTYETIGHPLRDRRNFIASTQADLDVPGAEMVRDIPAFLNEFQQDLWVIGGASVFEQTLARADELYITMIEADFGCDQFFPTFEPLFKLADQSELHEQNGFIFTYRVYKP